MGVIVPSCGLVKGRASEWFRDALWLFLIFPLPDLWRLKEGYFVVEIKVVSLSSRQVVYEGLALAMMKRLFVDHPN